MNQLAPQSPGGHAGIGQIDPQYRIILLHIRTEEQQRRRVEAEFESRQVARVMVVNSIRAAIDSIDVAAPIEYRESVSVLERAQTSLLKGDVRFDVERRRLAGANPPRNRLGWAAIDGRRLRQRAQPFEP
jgi:hypothetical protein